MADFHHALPAYLDLLTGQGRGEGWIELRYRHGAGMRSRFFPASARHGVLERRILQLGTTCDVYVGCSLRRSQGGSRSHIAGSWVLWAECDTADARPAVDAFEVPPSLIVVSGTPGHLHAYWALTRPVDVDALEDANRRLARAVSGDPVCYDAARILRPPGTQNHKHSPPRAVRALSSQIGAPHALGEILAALPDRTVAPRRKAVSSLRSAGDDALLAIQPEVYVAVLTGQTVGSARKVSCPFHRDRTPSLHVYPSAARGWTCFGCRRGGTIYDLAAAMWRLDTRGTDFLEVKRRLEARFLSRLPPTGPTTADVGTVFGRASAAQIGPDRRGR